MSVLFISYLRGPASSLAAHVEERPTGSEKVSEPGKILAGRRSKVPDRGAKSLPDLNHGSESDRVKRAREFHMERREGGEARILL
jgi:hypothetical protein